MILRVLWWLECRLEQHGKFGGSMVCCRCGKSMTAAWSGSNICEHYLTLDFDYAHYHKVVPFPSLEAWARGYWWRFGETYRETEHAPQ